MKRNIAAITFLLFLLIGFTYLSASTPIDSDLDTKKVNESYSKLVVPTIAYITVFEDKEISSIRDQENVREMFDKANQIWLPANIEFELDSIKIIKLEDSYIFHNPSYLRHYITNSPYYDTTKMNAYFMRSIGGPNGRSYGSGVVSVADKTTVYEYRTLAHEFGHDLGLHHVSEQYRLMASGTNGFELFEDEILNARYSAERYTK